MIDAKLDPPTPEQERQLHDLAASPFDPNDYKGESYTNDIHVKCRICGVNHSPRRVCGYCRMRVRMIRGLMTEAATHA